MALPDDLHKAGINPPGRLLQMSAPTLGFRFAWSPETKRVYAVKNGENCGLEIASNVLTEDAARHAVMGFTIGYRHRDREIDRNPNVRHHQMLAETGALGASMGK